MSIIHKIRLLHKDIYTTGNKLPKREKLGLHANIESCCVEVLSLAIQSAFSPPPQKKSSLESMRLKIEILKHLVRTEYEIQIIKENAYLHFSKQLIEISKMTNGWIKFLSQKGA